MPGLGRHPELEETGARTKRLGWVYAAQAQWKGRCVPVGGGEPSRYLEAWLLLSLGSHPAPSQRALPCSPCPTSTCWGCRDAAEGGCRDAAEGKVLGDGQVRATAQQCLHLQQGPQASRNPDTLTVHCFYFSRRPFETLATPQFPVL